MKKKAVIFAAVMIVCIAAAVVIAHFLSYSYTLKVNWNVEIPSGYDELYAYSTESSHGDGVRYHVFRYNGSRSAEKLDTMFLGMADLDTEVNHDVTELVGGWLEEIAVPTEAYPPYSDCACITAKQNDGSQLVLLWNSAEKTLYIAEKFM